MINAGVLDELRGRRMLVTGASSGIGAAAALALGACGAQIVVHYNAKGAGAESVVAAIMEAGGNALQRDLLRRAGAACQLSLG